MKRIILALFVTIFLASNAYADQSNNSKRRNNRYPIVEGLENLSEIMLRQNEILEDLKLQISSQTETTETEEVRIEMGEPYLSNKTCYVLLDVYINDELYKTFLHRILAESPDRIKNLRVRVLKNRFVIMYDIDHGDPNGIISYLQTYDKYPPFTEINYRL